MGIEPTDHTVNVWSAGFEDRGRHQAYKHFRINLPTVNSEGCL